ncbi:MAG TPA: N-acetylmuramoyl-L-alanine amidase [Burkholderiaceae bacterium]
MREDDVAADHSDAIAAPAVAQARGRVGSGDLGLEGMDGAQDGGAERRAAQFTAPPPPGLPSAAAARVASAAMPQTLPITLDPLPYEGLLDARPLDQIDLVVIHCTELPDLATARAFGEQVRYASGTGNSGHWYIDRDGTVAQWIVPTRTAHHVRGYNPRSVGIELVNIGRYPHWLHADHQAMSVPYPGVQIDALVALLAHLQKTLPALRWIAGHEDLDREQVAADDDPSMLVPRKRDPGPLFPWDMVLARVGLERFVA